MKALKKLTAVLTAGVLVYTAVPTYAADIYDITTETTIATGIMQKNIKRLTLNGWQNINVIEADLSDGRYGVKTLINTDDISKLTNVKDLSSTHGTLAAINGDFFSWKWDEKTLGSAIGGVVIDGEQHTSITSPWNFATVAQKDDGAFIFDYIDCAIAVAAPNGYITPIEHINKYDDLTQPIIYTKEWGPLSPGSAGTLSEIVIEDDTVVAINYDQGPVEFPENGYIIAFLRDVSPEITENFHIGDKVELGINYEPKFEDIQFAVGAGTLLLKDGEKTEITNNISGYQPRTAIGVNDDHSKLYLVTVDGRKANAKGVTLESLADIMAEIGADDAANLDGGGSTTLVIRSPYTGKQEVANTPSDNYLRPVANGVGIIPIVAADDEGFITIETDSDNIFAGCGIYLNVKVRDSLGNIIDAPDLKWKATDGVVTDSYYYPENAGVHTVTVSYNGMSATKQLRVLENPVKISTGLKEYKIAAGDSAYISLTAEDAKGYKAYINLSDTDITLSSSILTLDGNSLKGNKKGSAVATFDFGGIQTSAIIRVGGDNSKVTVPDDVFIADSIETPIESEDAFTFAVFGNTVSKNTFTEKLVMNKYTEVLKSGVCDLAIFAGKNSVSPEGLDFDNLTASKHYSYAKYKDSAFITLNSSDASQWELLLSEAKLGKTKNLFIIIPESIYNDSTYYEEMLIDYTEKNLSGTNVYVISAGSSKIINNSGIKHISVTGVDAVENAASAIENAVYRLFTVDGDKVHCENVKIYK
ncbi:MAG: phosphodiester glycosidase family protein [Clostridia bacterium]|nr:phosphodiester glycosidase family protein [Clostridia bacterium]